MSYPLPTTLSGMTLSALKKSWISFSAFLASAALCKSLEEGDISVKIRPPLSS